MKYRNGWMVMVLSFFLFTLLHFKQQKPGITASLSLIKREADHTAPFSLPLMRFQQTINNRQRSLLKMAYIKKKYCFRKINHTYPLLAKTSTRRFLRMMIQMQALGVQQTAQAQ